MPSTWMIEFGGIDPVHVRTTGIHHFLSAWFDETEAEHRSVKPYSIGNRQDSRRGVRLEVRCLDDRHGALVETVPVGHQVQFGSTFAHTAEVVHAPQLLAETTWEELAVYRGTTQWWLTLRTPTVVRRHTVDQPWPAPHAVLRGLHDKWNAWGPARGPFDDRLAGHVAVTGVELRTELTEAGRLRLHGAVGIVEWAWVAPEPGSDSPKRFGAAEVDSLLALAQFAGVGAYTQYGLGSVDVSRRRVSPSTRRRV